MEMLRLAGTAVAMAGSSEKVVAAAGGVVGASNDENGVAAAIETYVLSTRGLPPASEMGKIRVEIDKDEANELLAAVGVDDDADDVERRLPSPKAAAMAIQSETIRKKLEKEAAKKKEDEKDEKDEATTTVAKEERSIVETIAKEEEEPTRGPDLEMEEARRMNAELLEASKAAAARLAALRGTLKETEEELKRSEETQARKAERRAAKAEKARSPTGGGGEKSEGGGAVARRRRRRRQSLREPERLGRRRRRGGLREIAAESEQAAAVAAAASEAARRAEAAVGSSRRRRKVSSPRWRPRRRLESGTRRPRPQVLVLQVPSQVLVLVVVLVRGHRLGLDRFFSAALKTVTSLTSPRRGRSRLRRSEPPVRRSSSPRWSPRTSAATATWTSSARWRRRCSSWSRSTRRRRR